MLIDTDFDFTTDSYGYWDGFWERKNGLGVGGSDPDTVSETLKEYHRLLWSKELPNGEIMKLEKKNYPGYLNWNGMSLSSDAIIVSFRYKKYTNIINQVMNDQADYKGFYENIIRKAYTIGGMIIFPKHRNSINQNKGTNRNICDRWDLTLECIRRYYEKEESPLSNVLEQDRKFFDLFVDFKGYVDYFFLQDCVSEDYKTVDIWTDLDIFNENPLPKSLEEYYQFLDKEFEFLEKRNNRIKEWQHDETKRR